MTIAYTDHTSDARLRMVDALNVAKAAGVPAWHHHAGGKILEQMTLGNVRNVVEYRNHCIALRDRFGRDAADKEREPRRKDDEGNPWYGRDAETAEQDFDTGIYFEALAAACTTWITAYDTRGSTPEFVTASRVGPS